MLTEMHLGCSRIAPKRFADNELFRIITFFVFHLLCAELSSMCRSLEEYGWATPWRKPFHLNKQLKQAATNQQLLFSAQNYNVLESALDKANLKGNFPSDFATERICIYDNMNNQFLSVFITLETHLLILSTGCQTAWNTPCQMAGVIRK